MTAFGTMGNRLDRFVAEQLAATSAAGLAIGLTDRDRLLRLATYGYADVAARAPVVPETLFEIGSVSKAFTAIALLQLHEARQLELHAPVTRYLSWFEVRSRHAPITIHHLLSHTAGLVRGTDFSPDARYEVWAARETAVGGPPGERFHYSNLGYKILGLLLAEIAGKPYPEIIRERILAPLGMTASTAVITHETRHRLAVGYRPFFDDRPPRPADPLVPATWLETDTGDGSIAATAADLATYLRLLLNRGRGQAGPVLTEESFSLLTRPVIATKPGGAYGYGLAITEVDGRTLIGHDGGMVGYHTALLGDPAEGLGAVVLVNGPAPDPHAVAVFALALLRAAHRGDDLPPFPPSPDPIVVTDAAGYAGTYRDGNDRLELLAEGDRLIMRHRGEPIVLRRHGDDTFLVDHPDFALFPLRFGRDGERVVEAFHGPAWYAREPYNGPTTFDRPAAWAAYPGHYRSHNPWLSNFRVVPRKGALALIQPGGEEEPLLPVGDGTFRIGDDPQSPEHVRFDTIVGGRALRANLSGGDYYRFFTP